MRVLRSRAGKTLELMVEVEGGVIRSVEISGDFMAHPKEAVEELERRLRGIRVGEHERVVREALKGVELVGVTIEDILTALKECIEAKR